jgi:hypothetical protein
MQGQSRSYLSISLSLFHMRFAIACDRLFTAAGAETTPSQRREMRQKAFWFASILFSSLRDLCEASAPLR